MTGALRVRCPSCGQTPGAPCRDPSGRIVETPHKRRRKAARYVVGAKPAPLVYSPPVARISGSGSKFVSAPPPAGRGAEPPSPFAYALRALKRECYMDEPNPERIRNLEARVDRALSQI